MGDGGALQRLVDRCTRYVEEQEKEKEEEK